MTTSLKYLCLFKLGNIICQDSLLIRRLRLKSSIFTTQKGWYVLQKNQNVCRIRKTKTFTCDSLTIIREHAAVARRKWCLCVVCYVYLLLLLLINNNYSSFCRRSNINHNFAKGLLRRIENYMCNE